MKKKHKIYSKIKYPFIITPHQNHVIGFLSQYPRKNTVWLEYIEQVIYGDKKTGELWYVIERIPGESQKLDLLRRLMSISDYNPFNDPIPVENLPVNLRNMVTKILSQKQKT